MEKETEQKLLRGVVGSLIFNEDKAQFGVKGKSGNGHGYTVIWIFLMALTKKGRGGSRPWSWSWNPHCSVFQIIKIQVQQSDVLRQIQVIGSFFRPTIHNRESWNRRLNSACRTKAVPHIYRLQRVGVGSLSFDRGVTEFRGENL